MMNELSWILILTFYGGFATAKEAIVAQNEIEKVNVAPTEVTEEDVSQEAPTNFTLLYLMGPTLALVSWNPFTGRFEGYKIKTWSDVSGKPNEYKIQKDASKALISNLDPYTKNYAEIYVYNGKFTGPPSAVLSFNTPEGIPEKIKDFEAYPLGATAFLLIWEAPQKPNGILTGYNIYFSKLNGLSNSIDQLTSRNPQIRPADMTHAKLTGLVPNTNYRIYITAITDAGESLKYFIERTTGKPSKEKPSKPHFDWEIVSSGPPVSVRIVWLPNQDGTGGSDFFVEYRKRGQSEWSQSHHELLEDWIIITGLDESTVYDFVIVSTNGGSSQFYTKSDVKEVETPDSGARIMA